MADGMGQAARCMRCGWSDAPAGGGGTGFGCTALAQENSEDAALPGAQHEAAAGGKIEDGRITLQVQHAGHQVRAFDGLIGGPHGGSHIERVNADEAFGGDAEMGQAVRKNRAVFSPERRVGDDQDASRPAAGQNR